MPSPEETVIALVEFDLESAPPDAAVASIAELRREAATMPGNVRFDVLLDPFDDRRVCIQHEWTSAAALDAYLGSALFAALGERLRPLMGSAPRSRRLRAGPLEAQV